MRNISKNEYLLFCVSRIFEPSFVTALQLIFNWTALCFRIFYFLRTSKLFLFYDVLNISDLHSQFVSYISCWYCYEIAKQSYRDLHSLCFSSSSWQIFQGFVFPKLLNNCSDNIFWNIVPFCSFAQRNMFFFSII